MRERYLINSILRAGGILKTFAEGKGSFTLREMSQFMKLDRSTTYRLLLSLEKCGLVEKDEKTGTYSLGLGAFEIGSAYQRRADFVPIAKPFMEELALKAQETVNLAVLSGTEILYIDKVDSPRSVGVMSKIGQRNPVYCTSLGKSLLAFQGEEEKARIMAAIEFKPLTPHTITSRKEFVKEMNQIRSQGFALDRREIEEDVECIAAPIRNHLGNAVAAISISGPQKKIQTPREKEYVGWVTEAAEGISSRLGFKKADRIPSFVRPSMGNREDGKKRLRMGTRKRSGGGKAV
ncbi:MAG: IclR family transcriptional regulator [Deltaproteobacteria bacterium]|nr:MAG: IclR family transcriptional regulator [Deltaproteobacteria bacterium]